MADKYRLKMAHSFKKDVKLCKKCGMPLDELWTVIRTLLRGEKLGPEYKAHVLTGDRKGECEYHIRPNCLLVWEQHDEELYLLMLNTGTHADLFEKGKKR